MDPNNIQFNTPGSEFQPPAPRPQQYDISAKLIGWGLVKTRQEAEYVLIAAGVVALLMAFFLFRGASQPSVPPPPYVEVNSSDNL
jgi:hypothetical protein